MYRHPQEAMVSTSREEAEKIIQKVESRGCVAGKILDTPAEINKFLGRPQDTPVNPDRVLVPVFLPKGMTILEATR